MLDHDHPLDDGRWRGLYRVAGIGAIATALCLPLQIALYVAWPPPAGTSVTEWFALFQANPARGLLSLDLVMMVEQLLVVPIAVALWVVLHRRNESLMALAVPAWLVGACLIVASNTAYEVMSLANGYAAATTDALRAEYAAAGQFALASYWSQGSAFTFGYLMCSAAGIAVGFAMVRDGALGRAAGWAAVAGNAIGLGLFVPGIGIGLSLFAVVVLWAWYLAIGWRLLRAGRPGTLTRPLAAAVPASGR